MKQQTTNKNRTIFRAVGGHTIRKTLVEFDVLPYLLIHETPKYYTASRNGKVELHKKRVTPNSEWFESIDDALTCILKRIDIARESINSSLEEICDVDFSGEKWVNWIYAATFRKEKFSIYRYELEATKSSGYRCKEVTFTGKKYLYVKQSQPHNPVEPYEQWISKDLGTMLGVVRMYGEARLQYLHRTKQKLIDRVRIFNREREEYG